MFPKFSPAKHKQSVIYFEADKNTYLWMPLKRSGVE